jgi:HSP20 family protein
MIELRRIPRVPLVELRREMDRLFNGFLGPEQFNPASGPRAFPALNVWEDSECLFAEAEVPGLNMKDLEILIQGNELTIKGQRQTIGGEDVQYHRRERGTGEFARFVTLPMEVNADKVEATLKDGVLTIMMPKTEVARARKIAVKTA